MLSELNMFKVVSSSMEPMLPIGQYVFVKRVAFSELSVGDIVGIQTAEKLFVHRIINKAAEEGCFVTKGDRNSFNDNMVLNENNYIGKVLYVSKDENIESLITGRLYPIWKRRTKGGEICECNLDEHRIIYCNDLCIFIEGKR